MYRVGTQQQMHRTREQQACACSAALFRTACTVVSECPPSKPADPPLGRACKDAVTGAGSGSPRVLSSPTAELVTCLGVHPMCLAQASVVVQAECWADSSTYVGDRSRNASATKRRTVTPAGNTRSSVRLDTARTRLVGNRGPPGEVKACRQARRRAELGAPKAADNPSSRKNAMEPR